MRSTAAASVSVTLGPDTATASLSASSTAVPPTFTVNADAAGTDAVSRPPLKVTVTAAPFTVADENAGAVLLVTDWLPKFAALLPDRSRISFCPESGA